MHSLLPPSSAARRRVCPGSRALEAPLKKIRNPAAEEGELAHAVAAEYLNRHIYGENILSSIDNQLLITEEMIIHAKDYVEWISPILNFDKSIQSHIEECVSIHNIHPECFGTPDFFWFNNTDCYVIDYKYGFSPIKAYLNYQLIEYAAGISLLIEEKYLTKDYKFHLSIFQPRDYSSDNKIKEWALTYADLKNYIKILSFTEAQSLEPNAPFKLSKECSYCTARGMCPALQNGLTELQDRVFAMDIPTSNQSGELKFLKDTELLIKARITGLEIELTEKLKAGFQVPGFMLQSTSGRTVWKDEKQALEEMQMLGFNIRKDAAITPKQAIEKGVPEDLIQDLIQKNSGALKLIEDNAEEIFNKGVDISI